MNTDRIKEIQSKTAYPDSISVQQALLQVWNECEQEQLRIHDVVGQREQLKPKEQICYKSNEPCKYYCSGLCRESC